VKLRGIGRFISSRAVGAVLAASALSSACTTNPHYRVVDQADASTGGAPATGGKAGSGGATGGASGASGASGSGGGSGTGGAPSSGGTDGGTPTDAGDAEAGPKCDEKKSPDVEPCLVTDDHVVFVAPAATGADSGVGAGTMASPAHTINEGIVLAGATGKSIVVVCNATYAEEVTIPAVKSAIGVYGGFNCPGGTLTPWAYNGSAHATVQPTTPGPALDIENAEGAVVIADIAFTAMDAPKPTNKAAAQSSIGAIVNASGNVTFERVAITAGNGADGAKGGDGTDGADGATSGDAPVGTAASCDSGAPTQQLGGAWSAKSACGSKGGAGGTAQKDVGLVGGSGIPGDNTVTPPNTLNAGTAGTTVGATVPTGGPGSTGNDGTLAGQASTVGAFAPTGYTPADGNPGGDGNPGQGGGGGGSSAGTDTCVGASGGAGGMGGCGGTHGEAGKGGGASIALLVWGSGVTLDTVTLVSGNGGKGGNGGDSGGGGDGQTGGAGGDDLGGSPAIGRGGAGGPGARGGNGGSGSGGTGGPSFGIVFHGTAPQGALPIFTPGTGGPKGSGGSVQGKDGTPAPDGLDGLSENTHEQK
jgi:hypothetical protein